MANRGARSMNAGARERLVNQESGLLGVSIASHDMRDLLESALSDEAAAMRSSSTAISRANNLAHLLPCLAGLRRIVALQRANQPDISTSVLILRCHAELESAAAYAHEDFEDPPASCDWIWTDIKT